MADARTLLKMRLLLSIWIYTVDAIIICAYPIGTGMVFTYGHDATGTDCVVGRRFISHILEVVTNGRYYHNSFLEESQPYIPLIVFENRMYFGLIKVETGNIDQDFPLSVLSECYTLSFRSHRFRYRFHLGFMLYRVLIGSSGCEEHLMWVKPFV